MTEQRENFITIVKRGLQKITDRRENSGLDEERKVEPPRSKSEADAIIAKTEPTLAEIRMALSFYRDNNVVVWFENAPIDFKQLLTITETLSNDWADRSHIIESVNLLPAWQNIDIKMLRQVRSKLKRWELAWQAGLALNSDIKRRYQEKYQEEI